MKTWHFLWNSFYILGFLAISFRVTALVKGPLYHCNNVNEITLLKYVLNQRNNNPYSKVHGANMGPSWVLSAPDAPHVGPMNLDIREMTVEWNETRELDKSGSQQNMFKL